MKRYQSVLISLTFSMFLVIAFYLRLGTITVPFNRILQTFFNNGTAIETFVIVNIRLPRLMIVLFSGVALALSGSILQSVTQNDLADPGIIGINAGAGFGVTIFFLLFAHSVKEVAYFLPLAAFIGASVTSVMIFLLSRTKHIGLHPSKMILIGIGFSMAFSGLMILIMSSQERADVEFIASWLSGNIWGGDWPFVIAVVPLIIIAAVITYLTSQTLNVIQLGHDTATGLGVSLNKNHYMLLSLATLLAAFAVSVAGSIAFLGLVAPHIAKRLVGYKNQILLPTTALLGGTMLLLADLLGRNLVEPNGIPTGIIISLIGAPYFIFLLIKTANPV
ncbi:MAG: FecCD family ABC transporter permease [Bacillota bacterium]